MATNRGCKFRASPEFSGLLYREVESPSLRGVLDDANWPQNLLVYLQEIDPNGAVAVWKVIADGRFVHQHFGMRRV